MFMDPRLIHESERANYMGWVWNIRTMRVSIYDQSEKKIDSNFLFFKFEKAGSDRGFQTTEYIGDDFYIKSIEMSTRQM